MFRGFVISAAIHAALLAWAIVSIQKTSGLNLPDTPVIEATIVTASELTRLKKGDPDSKELEAKTKEAPETKPSEREAEKPKPINAPPPPSAPPPPPEEAKASEPPEPAKEAPAKPEQKSAPPEKVATLSPPPPPEPAPGPSPEELKKQEEARQAEEKKKKEEEEKKKAEQKKKEEEKKRKAAELKKKKEQEKKLAEAKRKAEEAKKKFDPSRIAALLDKTPEKRGAPHSAPPPSKPTSYTGSTAGEREGKDTVLTAREEQMLVGLLKSQIAPCWRLPGSGGGTQVPAVTLRWRMNPDGTLDGEPHVVGGGGGPAGQLAAEAAMRAVKGCQPYQLPEHVYAGWKEITWEFDPSKML